MNNLHTIALPIKKEMEVFERLFTETLHGHNNDFQSMIDFISGKNGKRIRPLILLLSAKLCGEPNEKSVDYAVMLELLHTATLIHDDVVDNTLERRGQLSVNAKYDNRVAVLLGDYILAMAITKAILSQNFAVLDIISRLSQNLAEGELAQLISSKELVFNEERYFNVIWKKTAFLLSSCSEMGAISVNASPENREKLRLIGENLGMCFQIKDDIFDYFDQGNIGKPTGNDIREGKITLPLIYALKTAPKSDSDRILALIKNRNHSPETIQQLTDFAKENKGIEYAYSKMQEIKENILALLSDFPDSDAKISLIGLSDYIIEREN
ncbi:MAG: polyprenyl synthetase family protein [Candidatus Azobacteroides sp.]|nr:polyprenyl synthetase family protein [Candidatus Azobacteroides sp.]